MQRRHEKAKQQPTKKAVPVSSPAFSPGETLSAAGLGALQLTQESLNRLQRTVGNRVTTRLVGQQLQREGEDAPLTGSQVTKAIGFYRKRATQYTPDIIRQLQQALGIPETGTVDEAMVQAAAVWQQAHPPLAVDGMIGPRTLPAIIPGGLAVQSEIETYVEGAQTVIHDQWAGLGTKEARADAILAKVNERLTAAGVPAVGKVIQDLDGDLGRFSFSLWSIRFDEAMLDSDSVADEADFADTVYHEARHAEQWFRMAQMRAGQGRTAAQIASEMGIPAAQAAAAFAAPLAEGSMDALIADGWYQSVYGTGREERRHALSDEGTFAEYQNLPEESDAWRVGGATTSAYQAHEAELDRAAQERLR